MKQILASVLFDILSYTIGNIILNKLSYTITIFVFYSILSYTTSIGNIIFCIFNFNNYNCKGIQTSAC